MTTTNASTSGAIAVLRHQARVSQVVVHLNVAGMTQAESLVNPAPGGNCANWVVGHLLAIYDAMLPLLGQEAVLPAAVRPRYDRGSAGLRDGAEPLEIAQLLTLWDESSRRVEAGLAAPGCSSLIAPSPMATRRTAFTSLNAAMSTMPRSRRPVEPSRDACSDVLDVPNEFPVE